MMVGLVACSAAACKQVAKVCCARPFSAMCPTKMMARNVYAEHCQCLMSPLRTMRVGFAVS